MHKYPAINSDADLLSLIGTGNTTAFKSLISRYHRSFMAIAVTNSLSHADGEECVGDAFMKIWTSAAKYEDFGIDPKYWLRTLMRHALLDKLRTLKRFTLEQSASKTDAKNEFTSDDYEEDQGNATDSYPTPLAALETKQANACFAVCLQTLSYAHRDTLQRCLLAGEAESVIAVQTGQSLGTVKSRKHYAIKKMQACVSDCLAGQKPIPSKD